MSVVMMWRCQQRASPLLDGTRPLLPKPHNPQPNPNAAFDSIQRRASEELWMRRVRQDDARMRSC